MSFISVDKKKTRLAVLSGLAASAVGVTINNIKNMIQKSDRGNIKLQRILNKIESANIPDNVKEQLKNYAMSVFGEI